MESNSCSYGTCDGALALKEVSIHTKWQDDSVTHVKYSINQA
jgi:hypothetical protein